MQALLVYNPAAGPLPVGPFVYRAADILRSAGWQMRILPTRSGEHAVELAKQAAGQVDVVFAIGGDGTIGQVASGLAGSSTALGILPAGTHNVMAAELGMRPFGWNRWWALDENLRQMLDAPTYNVDLGLCNGKPFLLWAGLGLDAMILQQLETRLRIDKYLSVPQSAALGLWNATFWRGVDLKIDVDSDSTGAGGQRLEGHYVLAVMTNIRTYLGGLAQISPAARLDDGQMDLWLFPGDNLADTFRHIFGMLAGLHQIAPDVVCVPFRTLRLESGTPVSLQMDGEPQGPAQVVECSILPGALKLLVPRRSLDAFLGCVGARNAGHSPGTIPESENRS